MPIKGKNKVINAFTHYCLKKRSDAVWDAIGILESVGADCLQEARTAYRYTVQSGNLISSTGYAIFLDG